MRSFFGLYAPLTDTWRVYDNSFQSGPVLIARGGENIEENIYNLDLWNVMRKKYYEYNKKNIDELFDNGSEIDEALQQAVKESLLQHKKAGNIIVSWEKNKIELSLLYPNLIWRVDV
ncbi:MAG: hypothetical protein K8F52_19270 [Candidatus Scalindua rubra]|uniref:Uncharacterized protein n=1 Tax=Candidatus Scalindua brodae TaxID=237368 RepID=A0A0B0EF59_9BACT|nr:MAG: hypothetical protein SCABRO_02502 [Candidatus Scalindua brodae]MBZ0110801.1 hypothetical protein [Candidatus Scalindua rubra]TWU31490.1 hypothetical protein S225a_21630 [Candidatus Brocadiaceae bacterium S225]